MKSRNIESLESRMMLASSPTVGIYTSDNTASESHPTTTGKGVFVVKRLTGSTSKALAVSIGLRSASTATSGADFIALPTSVTIPKGQTSVNLGLITVNDSDIESTEKVVLGVKSGNYTIVHDKATVTIADNDLPQVGIYTTDSTASETDPSGAGKGVFQFKRPTGPTSSDLVLSYYVRSTSTATSGDDFVAISGSITIPAGQRTANLNLIPVDDGDDEPDETVTLVLRTGNFTNIHNKATVTIADDDVTVGNNWFGDTRRYRTSISVDVGNFARSDQPVDTAFNFSDVLGDLSASGSLNDDSIKVVEVNGDGSSDLDDAVPFQFDHDSDFNASSNASGDLVIVATGSTSASTVRHYQVYFDTTGSFSAPSFTAQVITTPNDSDQGRDAVKVQNQTATFYLQYDNGGFSSIVDSDGNDWLGFDPTPGSDAGGEFRGTPNAVYPGGGFHAGFDVGSTGIINSGPLKTTVESTITVGKGTYKMRYEFYGQFVRATIVDAGGSYWFLYEGTPGGSVDSDDSVVRSDGTETGIDTSWNEDSGIGHANGEEWLYFRDSDVNRFIYFAHNEADGLKDSYYRMDDNGSMTVFGFGRDNDAGGADHSLLTAQNNSFTFGIVDGGSDFNTAAATIEGQYKVLNGSIGISELSS